MQLWDCPFTGAGCGAIPTGVLPPPHHTDGHPTVSLGLLFSDLTEGQDPAVPFPPMSIPGVTPPPTTAQIRRSASSEQVEGFVYAGRNGGTTWLRALDTMVLERASLGRDLGPQIVSLSGDVSSNGVGCSPNTYARTADDASDHGLASFIAAGNNSIRRNGMDIQIADTNGSTCEMRRTSYGTGTFVVNQHRGNRSMDTIIRSGEFGARSIVDMTTYGVHTSTLVDVGGTPTYGGPSGTSVSTPILASAATVFQDFYANERSRLVDDPGILYANLLLMGDRWASASCPAGTDYCDGPNAGFDPKSGAGRFRLRTFSSSANPKDLNQASWASGRLCVGKDPVDVPIPSPATPPADPWFDAVARWTDADGRVGGVDIELFEVVDGVPTPLGSDTSNDTKKRARGQGSGNASATYFIRFTGRDVRTKRNDFCPRNEQRVHFAAKVEAL